MNLLNDGNPTTVDTWVIDSGAHRNVAIVQDPEKPLAIYLDGVQIYPCENNPNSISLTESTLELTK